MFGKKPPKKEDDDQPPGRDGLEEDADILSPQVLKRMKARDEKNRKALAAKNADDDGDDTTREEIVIMSVNWLAWCIFQDCSTQWRTAMNGPTGLDYNVVFQVMDAYRVRNKLSTLRKVKLIEGGALAGFKGVTRQEIGVFAPVIEVENG